MDHRRAPASPTDGGDTPPEAPYSHLLAESAETVSAVAAHRPNDWREDASPTALRPDQREHLRAVDRQSTPTLVSVPAERTRRADAGSTRVSARDLELLRFVGEQYAITLPQLARLMGRSQHAARWLRARWQRAGWIEGRVLLVGEPVFVWLTRPGKRLAASPYKLWSPNAAMLAHIGAVSDVRLWVKRRRPDAEWVSERALAKAQARGPGQRHGHRPDALVRAEGQEVAVEVELALKKRERLERLVRETVHSYGSVWYFAAPAPQAALEQIAQAIGGERVQVVPLSEVQG